MTAGKRAFGRKCKGFVTSISVVVWIAAGSSPGFGQIQLSTSTPYTQDFNAMGTLATATVPPNFKVDRTSTSTSSDVRKVGTFSAAGTATTQVGGANLSSTASNGIYNFGDGTTSTGDSNSRSVGFLASGTATASGNLYAWLANNTGDNISALLISYNVKKFRSGTNTAGFRIQLFYSTDGANWTTAGSDFLTPFAGGDASNAGFNPAPGATVPVSNKALNLNIANGGNLYLAWNYSVTTGTTVTNAQALSVDDISILGLATQTNPTGSGSATPNPVTAGAVVTLSATIAAGANPPSTGLAVSCDLTSLGGSSTFSLASQTATVFASQYQVPPNSAASNYTLPCTVTDAQGRSGTFNISLSVTLPPIPPPILTKSFADSELQLFGPNTTALSFTITNPNNTIPLTGVAFSDTLPSGLIVSTPNGLTGSCGGGTITAVAGSNSISVSGATLPPGASLAPGVSCTFSVNVTATEIGVQTNTTSTVTSNEAAPGAPATGTISVDDLFFYWFFAA